MKVKKIIGITLLVLLFSLLDWTWDHHGITVEGNFESVYAQDRLYGKTIGIIPGRVVWNYNPNAVEWDGNLCWWEVEDFDQLTIQTMLQDSLGALVASEKPSEAWEAIFRYNNESRGKASPYLLGEEILIKVNRNGTEVDRPYTHPILLKSLLLSLVEEAGVSPENITVYDGNSIFPEDMVKLSSSGVLQGVEFSSILPSDLSEVAYVIDLVNFQGCNCGFSNGLASSQTLDLSNYLTQNKLEGDSLPLDTFTSDQLQKKTVLYMLDALITPAYTASIFLSQDPWAIDSVGRDFLTESMAFAGRDENIELIALSSTSNDGKESVQEKFENSKVLIAYFDPRHSLDQAVQIIAEKSGGDVFEIKTTQSYSEIYHTALDQTWQDQKDVICPEIFTKVDNMASYDIVFIAYSVLWRDLPEAVSLFLEDYDLSGKVIVPFCTYNNDGFERSFERVSEVLPEQVVLNGFSVDASTAWQSKEKIEAWLESLEIANK